MQFMTTWTLRDGNGDSSERIAEGKKILEAFSRSTGRFQKVIHS